MNKFKICPECGTKNPPDVSDCINCDCDLMSVAVNDETLAAKNFSSMKRSEKKELVKICSECGAKNLPNVRKCSNCGEDISDILATPESEVKAVKFALKSLDGKFVFKIDENIIVGRENAMQEYLAEKIFVSRRHCRFTVEGDEIFVEDLNSANSTYVNNKKIFGKTKLSKGDELGLGGAIFNGSRQNDAAYFVVC